jgi:hypothetical protein
MLLHHLRRLNLRQLSRQQLNPSPRQPQMSPHVNQSSHPNMMGTDPNQLHSDPNLLLGSLQGFSANIGNRNIFF